MRVLVCGGRDYANERAVHEVLNSLHTRERIEAVITGGATGADRLAELWAYGDMQVIRETADWRKHGRAAGPMRNQRMLDIHRPSLVVAFPGGTGTADMVRRARKAGVLVLEIDH